MPGKDESLLKTLYSLSPTAQSFSPLCGNAWRKRPWEWNPDQASLWRKIKKCLLLTGVSWHAPKNSSLSVGGDSKLHTLAFRSATFCLLQGSTLKIERKILLPRGNPWCLGVKNSIWPNLLLLPFLAVVVANVIVVVVAVVVMLLFLIVVFCS